MSCPTCDATMQATGCEVTDRPFFWCPRCGTFKSCDGDVATPALVLHLQTLVANVAPSKEIEDRIYMERFHRLGIIEATNLPDRRPPR